ncbi:MAG: nucleoid occlusion protein [Caldicoprobacterales bacterium]|nr:nucleoid occlusion protein [Clostridia bacterium]MDI9513324.1 nucleoid occlusion protein [Bacillota bacterium]NLH59688.1 nucleoid occlusion protein [Clostridiales bacterium]
MLKLNEAPSQGQTLEQADLKVENIPVNLVRPNPYQPRKTFSLQALDELARSIKEYGVIQPITVRQLSDKGYELVAGERRLRACKLNKMEFIPAIIIDSLEQDSAMIALIENLQREDLHYIEEAKGYASLINDHNMTQEQLATKLGKSQSTIANKLRILRLPDRVKDMVIKENLTERHARALLKLADEDLQTKVAARIIEKKLNVRETEALIERYIDKIQERKAGKLPKSKQKILFKRSKDVRVFINTIHNAVKMMKDYGVTAGYSQVDKGDRIEITVTIPKG